MIQFIINRPVFAAVISILIVILGILGLTELPVTQYPDIAPPTVQINATYPGANAKTVMESVVIPIEEQVNGVEDMDYISSTASNNGSANISVFFKPGVDPDIAAVNVQNRVARATPILPSEVNQTGVVTQKQQTSALMFISLYSSNEAYDQTFIENYGNINITPALKRINGVGDANVFGGRTYAMRVWLKPEQMKAYGLNPSDVTAAIQEQSREVAAGQIGSNAGNSFEYVITYKGRYNEKEQYDDIIIKSIGNGQFLRLKDVADIEMGGQSYAGIGRSNGDPAVSIAIYQTPGSNAQTIINDIKAYFEQAEASFPEGIGYRINFDTNEFLDASISKVVHTIIEAFILVFLVVFIFLQDIRSTLIPAIAVPVSLIGSFFFLNLFGFSINLLTLFAMVLAIGIVVDDAIVVVEAVHAKLENGEHPKEATKNAMSEITGAIISITLVLAAVFVPVTFISGPTGVFYQQFGITLIITIIISAINALTLSPMLCALFLKHKEPKAYENKNIFQRFFHKFNTGFDAATKRYGNMFTFLFRHKWVTVILFVIAGLGIYFANSAMPSGFVPNEDRGIIFINAELPPGASMDRTYLAMEKVKPVVEQIPGVQSFTYITGRSFLGGAGSNQALGFIKLNSFEERTHADGQSVDEITGKLFGVTAGIPDAQYVFFGPPSIQGYGISAGFEIKLLDRFGGEVADLDAATQNFIQELMARPEIQYAQSSFKTGYPQLDLELNVPRIKEAGLSISDILSALQGYIGGVYASDFTKYGKYYRVSIQALPEDRKDVSSLNEFYIRTSSGQMAPISQFASLDRTYGPPSLNRFNLFNAVTVSGANNPGYSTGDAISAVQEVAETLPSNYSIDYSGLTREEVNAGSETVVIFILCLIFVYFILSALYESFIVPFSVIFSLPFGIMGAYLGQWLFGLENNIYFQIALVMLVGLLAKNAILIVEFAQIRRMHGETIAKSAINAAKARLRPILMTSFAFICGLLPLVFASGIGAVGNRSVATGAAIGLLIGTIFGLVVIPVLYVIFQALQERIKPIKFDSESSNIH
ncbi:efflux RND transporter permease subunit [Moheibacter lacus]|uniref:Efflux RND transporter permease subunit n=1 Tax=Moheibacter lacus TaxID=2745851 RepID=A0A838ZKR7_9FLAO|nr:efflux RND transporter permease subunit [Moheibacter lacus]MBA5629848.1 efflux RND transporter permease subunit [Moheibacter lacus]